MTKKAISTLPFPVHFHLSSFALPLQPRLITSKMRTKHDPTLKYMANVVDFGEHSNNEIQRAVLPRTESSYSDTLLIFDEYVPIAVIPLDIRTCRAFLEWVLRGINGRIEERPTVETIQGFFRKFATSIKRKRNFEFPPAIRTTINKYIIGELRIKIPLSTKQMNKDGSVSPNDLTILITQLWCRDHHKYRGNPTDRARVQLSTAILLYCFTSTRIGEVYKSTARRYGAREIGEESEDTNLEAHVIAAYYKEIPKHVFYEVYAEDMPIFLNFLTFFLPIAAVDTAFRDYGSVSEILDTVDTHKKVGHSEDKILKVIYVREEIRNIPVFRQYLKYNIDNFKGNTRGADSFGKALVNLGHRSGYTLNITARRLANDEIDKIYSESIRIKFARQTNRDIYGKSYAYPLSKNRRGIGLYRNSSLFQLLPIKAEYKFLAREDIYALDQTMVKLSLLLSDATPEEKHEIQLKQKRIYNKKRSLYNKELRKV
ncbi:Zinc finger C2H2 [Penicillium cf. viridicatum]|uniref:Zinc finger C2H2 n=1 Tax=Penicillium cf. viridicatum TaxID=2972119 RepID=A0A9W9MJ67_9EURO|nr:Zinc finger C2H2 [Penicillium cf. viridicatum]